MNPWDISDGEARVLDAMVRLGAGKVAARELGISNKTVEAHVHAAKRKMGVQHTVPLLIRWDRHRATLVDTR